MTHLRWAALVVACLAAPLGAQDRPRFTLPDSAADNLPAPRPPIDISGAHIFTLDGLFETIESISDMFDEAVHFDNIDAFAAMGADPGVLVDLRREDLRVSVQVRGDWSMAHEGVARGLVIPFEDGNALHRLNIHLPGYAYPWVFAARLPEGRESLRLPLISQLAASMGNAPDLRNQPLRAAFGAAAQHLFRPDRFDGRLMLGLDWRDVTDRGLFEGTFTLVDQGSLHVTRRFAEGPVMRLLAVVREYEGETPAIAPRPTGRVGLVEVLVCPVALRERTPEICQDWLREHEDAVAESMRAAEDAAAQAQAQLDEITAQAEAELQRAEAERQAWEHVEAARRQIEAELERIETIEYARRMREEALRRAEALVEREMARAEMHRAESELGRLRSDSAAERYVETVIRYSEAVRREAIIGAY